MADREYRLDEVLDPFDFEKYPSMSSQVIEAFPSAFGAEDPNLLQTANRVMIGGPLDLFDLAMRTGDVGMRGVSEGVEYGTGLEGIRRDIYGLLTAGGLMAGASPSPMPLRTSPSSRGKSAPQSSTPDSGIMAALPAPEPMKALPAPKKEALKGEIVSGASDKYLRLKAEKDKAISDARKTQLQEDMNLEAFRDSLKNIENVVDEEFTLVSRDIIGATPEVRDFMEALEDSVLYRVDYEGMSMADALLTEMPKHVEYYNMGYNTFFDSKDLIKRMAPRLDEYGYGVTKDLRRREEGDKARREMQNRRARAIDAQQRAEAERAMGITPDMTPEQKTAAIVAAREKIVREANAAQNALSGIGIPDETSPMPPKFTIIEGGKVD